MLLLKQKLQNIPQRNTLCKARYYYSSLLYFNDFIQSHDYLLIEVSLSVIDYKYLYMQSHHLGGEIILALFRHSYLLGFSIPIQMLLQVLSLSCSLFQYIFCNQPLFSKMIHEILLVKNNHKLHLRYQQWITLIILPLFAHIPLFGDILQIYVICQLFSHIRSLF